MIKNLCHYLLKCLVDGGMLQLSPKLGITFIDLGNIIYVAPSILCSFHLYMLLPANM